MLLTSRVIKTSCAISARSLDMCDAFIERLRADSGPDIVYQRNGTFELALSDVDVAPQAGAPERLTFICGTTDRRASGGTSCRQKSTRNPSSICRGLAPLASPVDRPKTADRKLPVGAPRLTKLVAFSASTNTSSRSTLICPISI